MKCSKAKKLIIGKLDGIATGAANADARLENHVAACPECRKYHDEVKALLTTLRSASAPEKSDYFWSSFTESVIHKIRQSETTRSFRPAALPPQRSPFLRPVLTLIPAALILAVVSVFLLTRAQSPGISTTDYETLMTMFDDGSLLNIPAGKTVIESHENYSKYYENAELPEGVFSGRDGLLQGATPADIVSEISESDLEAIYKSLPES